MGGLKTVAGVVCAATHVRKYYNTVERPALAKLNEKHS